MEAPTDGRDHESRQLQAGAVITGGHRIELKTIVKIFADGPVYWEWRLCLESFYRCDNSYEPSSFLHRVKQQMAKSLEEVREDLSLARLLILREIMRSNHQLMFFGSSA